MSSSSGSSPGRLVVPLLAGPVIALFAARGAAAYHRDLEAAAARLAAVDRDVVNTAFGPVEYAERGTGEPVLVSHGVFHGCDGALLSTRDLLRDRRIIAPSRFGYLGSALPSAATSADQADAFVALLDALAIDTVDVFCVSAGTTAAIQLALRHPDRVRHLVISSGNLPGSPTAAAPAPWARMLYNDPTMWTLKVAARPMLTRLMGVPSGFPRDAQEHARVSEMLDSIFPVRPRVPGAVFDAFVSNPAVNDLPLESLTVPTLLIHARDDPLTSYDSARRAAARIPGATLVTLESGGHPGLGQADRSRTEVAAFLATPSVRPV